MHALFEQMNAVKVDRAKGVTIRAGVWQEWLRLAAVEVQPALDRDAQTREAKDARTRRSA